MSTQIQELIAAETKASSIVAEARACEQTTTSLPDEAYYASILDRNKRVTLRAAHLAMGYREPIPFSCPVFAWWRSEQPAR